MTTRSETPIGIGRPEDFGLDPEAVDRRMREAQRNHDYFMAHYKELFERYPDHWLLIHSGEEVVPFDDLVELINLLETFDPVKRGGAIIERQRKGVWVL